MSLSLLQLLHFADSALPIGSTAHSLGLETLTSTGRLTVQTLESFLADYLREAGRLEAGFCCLAYRLASVPVDEVSLIQWRMLNWQLSCRKPARESRDASTTLGRRFLQLAANLEPAAWLGATTAVNKSQPVHHCLAFGLVGGVLTWGESATVGAYLQQQLTGLLLACQRLLPLGQSQAMQIAWRLKPELVALSVNLPGAGKGSTQQGEGCLEELATFQPMLELASMRHATLSTRLFIS
jgi:urease accessory protein